MSRHPPRPSDDPPHDPTQEQAEALMDKIQEIFTKYVIDYTSESIDWSGLDKAIYALCEECYQEGYNQGMTDEQAAGSGSWRNEWSSPYRGES